MVVTDDGTVTIDMEACARCDIGHHVAVIFRPLEHPVELLEWRTGEPVPLTLTHWAPCPTNGEPILMHITADASGATE